MGYKKNKDTICDTKRPSGPDARTLPVNWLAQFVAIDSHNVGKLEFHPLYKTDMFLLSPTVSVINAADNFPWKYHASEWLKAECNLFKRDLFVQEILEAIK